MNDKFLNVCDCVNLITKPCEYKGFKLKPGMLLFDTNDRYNLTEPFVAVCDITNQQNQHIGNLSNAILLSGYSLKDCCSLFLRINPYLPILILDL